MPFVQPLLRHDLEPHLEQPRQVVQAEALRRGKRTRELLLLDEELRDRVGEVQKVVADSLAHQTIGLLTAKLLRVRGDGLLHAAPTA